MAGGEVREWLERNRGGLVVGALGMVGVAVAVPFLVRPAPPPVIVQAPTPRSSPAPAAVPIAVHVGGEVLGPGLYHLPLGSRVNDAIRAAGGPTADADPQRLNLAARLADGQQVLVPRKVEPRAADGAASPTAPARMNINTATVKELDGLPGVGPVTAQRIVAYREQHGPFTRVEQLREAKLVNASTFERLKDLVTV